MLEIYKTKSIARLQVGLNFIEELYVKGDAKTKGLATLGFLEGIQNVWGNNETDPELIFEMLGEKSKKAWQDLNKFWEGEIPFIPKD